MMSIELPAMRIPFGVEQLLAFVTVADSGHVTRAADDLGVTQSTVTHHLKAFERALGLRLFERAGRRLRPTDAGRSLVAPARVAARSLEQLMAAADDLRSGKVGELKVGASQTSASHYLPLALADFPMMARGLVIDVSPTNTTDVCALVADGTLDVGVIEGPPTEHSLQVLELAEDEVVFVVSSRHPLASRRQLRHPDLLSHRYLAREPGSGTELLAASALGDFYPRIPRLLFRQMDAVRAAVRAGLGFAALPRVAIDDDLAGGRLVALPLPPRHRWIRAVRRPAPGGPVLESFWQHMAEKDWVRERPR
jgi:DNA-binding transcriptional LysR family regulator